MPSLSNHSHDLPAVPRRLLAATLPREARDELLADIAAEFAAKSADEGVNVARRWLWRQALRSAPALVTWGWWRARTGFESPANAYRPGGPMLRTWITDARYAAR